MFSSLKDWSKTKASFATIAICAVASMKRPESQPEGSFPFRVSSSDHVAQQAEMGDTLKPPLSK